MEPDSGGRYTVYYTPVEVGLYNIAVKWNGKEIEGSLLQIFAAQVLRTTLYNVFYLFHRFMFEFWFLAYYFSTFGFVLCWDR